MGMTRTCTCHTKQMTGGDEESSSCSHKQELQSKTCLELCGNALAVAIFQEPLAAVSRVDEPGARTSRESRG
eukprot:scaffold251218_cov31-Prasinocladus_malaysianus.AAC.1